MLGGVRRVVDDHLAGADHVGLGSSASSRAACSRPIASRIRASSSAGPQVCSTTSSMPQSWATTASPPSVTTSRTGHVGAGRADQPAQVAGVGELLAAVDEDQVGVGRLEQGAALGGQDLDLVAEQGERRAAPRRDGWRALVSSSSVLMRVTSGLRSVRKANGIETRCDRISGMETVETPRPRLRG